MQVLESRFKNRIKFFKCDIRNEKSLNSIFHHFETKNNPIQAVMHFAGLKSVEESIQYPEKYKEFNVYGSHNLFNIMEKYNCKNIVFRRFAGLGSQNGRGGLILIQWGHRIPGKKVSLPFGTVIAFPGTTSFPSPFIQGFST